MAQSRLACCSLFSSRYVGLGLLDDDRVLLRLGTCGRAERSTGTLNATAVTAGTVFDFGELPITARPEAYVACWCRPGPTP